MRGIRFAEPWSDYGVGQTAVIPDDLAARLVEKGVALFIETGAPETAMTAPAETAIEARPAPRRRGRKAKRGPR